MPAESLYIGLMSGTSMDGIDAALVAIADGRTRLIGHHSAGLDTDVRARLTALAAGDEDNIHTLASLDRTLGFAFGRATRDLVAQCGKTAADITAIGSHGQTVRHHPEGPAEERYSLQIGDPATIAELTGVTTVADFRRRDIAAGGEGAPLVPLFHAAQFAHAGECRAIVNIGGISNATLLSGDTVLAGFDCGPGNTLLDAWIRRQRGDAFDAHGAWAAEHEIDRALLDNLADDAYFNRRGPRSTGPEHFNMRWLEAQLQGTERPGDVQATLSELTALAIANSFDDELPKPAAVYVCGGGARNTDLMRRLHSRLDAAGIRLGTTDELGLAAEWVEASAFAWLAHRTLAGLPGNAPVVTGALESRILGAIYPASQ